jgi:hypothetical protein
MSIKDFCLNLAMADSEDEVVDLLTSEGYWENPNVWEHFGGNENNFSIIGAQQSKPEAALVEKLINSVDAVLIAECLESGINPQGKEAPQSIKEAQKKYFGIRDGKLSNITSNDRARLAENIYLVATGKRSNPSYMIIDSGEGQTPENFQNTFLSIGASNKLRIPFVQGKFNMGGTGVLQFCGKKNFQLIISKRYPKIRENEAIDDYWGVSIVRRFDPVPGTKSSTYKYLAPEGQILKFKAESLPLKPSKYPNPYGQEMRHGTFIKLYEYQIPGYRTNILLDLYNRLSTLIPSAALPIRLCERRTGYKAHSYETTLSGLTVRLEDDKRQNLEDHFPASFDITIDGQEMGGAIYAFKSERDTKYTKGEGVIFTVNGQTHGDLDNRFFKKTGMGYIADSLLVTLDCSGMEGRAREDLFMNSRDRIRKGELRANIEKSLENLIRNHKGLRELREKRKREALENQLADSQPLANVIEKILKQSPALANLLIKGVRLPNPLKSNSCKPKDKFIGKKIPSFFKLDNTYDEKTPKTAHLGQSFRVQYSTDADNDYLSPDRGDPGEFKLYLNNTETHEVTINLWNGVGTLSVTLPENAQIGDTLVYKSEVTDVSRPKPFADEFVVTVKAEAKSSNGSKGKRRPPASKDQGNGANEKGNLALPNVVEVSEEKWERYKFSELSALGVIDNGEGGYDFFINIDNLYLKTEQKFSKDDKSVILKNQFMYGMTLVGLALINNHKTRSNSNGAEENQSDTDIESTIKTVTASLSPVMLPMICSLGEITEEKD